ncbi:MAG TPA: hypothetical protein VGI40_28150 [Pirellulaceae bacterium]
MFVENYRAGLIISAVVGSVVAMLCYGSYAGDLEGYSLLAMTGALSGVAFWLLYINDYLGISKR